MRCIRAVKSLRALEGQELQVAALYTAVDRAAPFVRHADVAVQLPVKTTPVGSYLDHELLLSALRAVGADAVWPGWGFVAESPEFVDRLTSAGIRFLGPSAATMRALGDKIASKLLAEKVDVPVTAWSGGVVANAQEALEHAERIGFPVVVKASAGGGGRGIRVVRKPEQMEESFRSAQSEARSAFGDDRMFVEAMVQGGRHIEVQVIADLHGTVVALGCRDCSVQRRHQKVIEEAPPVGLPPLMFRALKESAVALAEHVGYSGAGTVEFLVRDADFFFLEMNPRLQVEHGITEEITGTDLVQLQIRVARGEPLPIGEVRERGFAIEARVCAEDPDAGFLPAPGRIARFDPALGTRLRIDTGVASDSTVPAAFDSLIAKVIASGDTREEARARLVTALRDFDLVIEGGATNKGYLIELLEAADVRKGGVDTSWLDKWNEKRAPTAEFAPEAFLLAGVLSYREARAALTANFFLDPGTITHDKIAPSDGLEFDLSYRGKQHRTRVFASGAARYRVHFDSRVVPVHLAVSTGNAARLQFEGRDLRVLYDVTDIHIRVEVEGHVHRFGRQTAGQVRANAPSMVVSLAVDMGSRVEAGDPLGMLEAMKMEIGFDAPVSGVVTEIRARKGQQVAAGEVILVIDPKSDEGDGQSDTRSLELPLVPDPLGSFFDGNDPNAGSPNLARAASASGDERKRAMSVVAEEIRRIVLGYDAFAPRVETLIGFLEAPVPPGLALEFYQELAEIKTHLCVFADIERLFTRSTRQRLGTGELNQLSNNALMRLYLRRVRADGSGLPEAFSKALETGLKHYDDVTSLTYSDALERAVMRMFASQLNADLRNRLIGAIVHRIAALSDHLDLSKDDPLQQSLSAIASLRGHVPNQLADSVTEAIYLIYQRPQLHQIAERTTKQLELWLNDDSPTPAAPDFTSLALIPSGRFRQVLKWLSDDNPRRRTIALSASVRRLYTPRIATGSERLGPALERVAFGNEQVAATLLPADSVGTALPKILDEMPKDVRAVELFVVTETDEQSSQVVGRVEQALGTPASLARLTLTLVDASQTKTHHTFDINEGAVVRRELFGMHPEAARRIEFHRYQSFELERLEAADDIYCFYGRSHVEPDDARMFVLADIRGRSPEGGNLAKNFQPIFERAFYEAARTLRLMIGLRDPRRHLQWNRIMLFVGHPLELEATTAERLAQALYPATRHLGLERVGVRLQVIENGRTRDVEVVVSDATGSNMEIQWREPHSEPLLAVEAYQRAVVAARRRGLVYPYEIIRLLAPESVDQSAPSGREGQALPPGTFEEYDLGADGSAVSVAGREPGKNESAVVFGVISTPTDKVPEGMRRVLLLSDPTRNMGALAKSECDRVVAAIDLAEREKLPVEWLPVSSGARIAMDSGTENLDATARVVRRIVTFTQEGGTIHVIVMGVNVGAQSYWDALATMLGHTKGALIMTPRASMVLTGRAALAASGSVSAEDEVAIGGYERVMGPNGQAQYYAEDLGDAYRILYQHYNYTYVVPGERGPRLLKTSDRDDRDVRTSAYEAITQDFAKVGELFDPETNPGRKRPFAMRALMRAIADSDGGALERWQAQVGGETAIVWDVHLGGMPVCMLGIESHNVVRWGYRPLDGPADWNGGTLFPVSSKKVSRALNAASGNRPVVIIANLSGFDGSPESMRKLQLEYGAEIARAVVNFQGPLLFLVVSRYHGGAYVVFSRALNPNLRALAVEGSYASVIGGGPAATVVFPREVRSRVSRDPRVQALQAALGARATPKRRAAAEKVLEEVKLEKQAEVAAQFDKIHSVERALEVGSLEAIIAASEIRQRLIELLRT
jgi:acetyl/propionyl-CoA carboxylase alpha subunit/acetyl-CoA carboxylase carboxyltransferase component